MYPHRPEDTSSTATPATPGRSAEEDDIDAVPDAVRLAARAAFAMRDREAEVLELVYDSAFDRGPTTPRRLSFGSEAGAPVVELEVTEQGDRRSVVVTCALPDAELVAVESVQGRSSGEPSSGGWTASDVPAGSCSVVLTAGSRRVRTSWTLV